MEIRTMALTLVVVLIAVAALGGLVALSRRDRALTYWSVGFAFMAVGLSLVLAQDAVGPAWAPALVLGNALIVGFHLSQRAGLAVFLGVSPAAPRRFAGYLAATVVALVAFTYVWPSYPARAMIASLAIIVAGIEFLVLLRRGRDAIPALIRGLFATLTATFLVLYAVRIVLLTASHAPNLLSDRDLTPASLLITLLFAILWSGALLLLDGSRLQRQIEAHAQELQRLNTLKDRVLAMTSHDLRGPMGNLRAVWAELNGRYERGECNEEDRELLALVDRSLGGTQDLLENLFSFADPLQQKADPDQRSALPPLVSSALALWEPMARAKGVTLTGEVNPAVVTASHEAVATVLRNLIGNAVKFTPAGGRVVVRVVSAAESEVRIDVEDTGIGMDPSLLDQPFRPTSRHSRPGTEGERGSGFGLVLVRELVEGWGGRLAIDSAPGRGTLVSVTFR